jgi:hypothetical protein
LLCSFARRKGSNRKRDEKKAIRKIFPNKRIGKKSHSGELI